MNKGLRIGIIVGLVVILAGLFLVMRPSGDDSGTPPDGVQTEVPVPGTGGADNGTGGHVHTITVKDGEVSGDRRIEIPKDTELTLVVKADVEDEVHVHGYDVTADVTPDSPAQITLTADTPGTFEVELESSGLLLTEIEVTP